MRSLVWYEAQAAEDGAREKALRYVDDAKIKDFELQYKPGSSTTLVFRCFTTRQWKKTKNKTNIVNLPQNMFLKSVRSMQTFILA